MLQELCLITLMIRTVVSTMAVIWPLPVSPASPGTILHLVSSPLPRGLLAVSQLLSLPGSFPHQTFCRCCFLWLEASVTIPSSPSHTHSPFMVCLNYSHFCSEASALLVGKKGCPYSRALIAMMSTVPLKCLSLCIAFMLSYPTSPLLSVLTLVPQKMPAYRFST